MSYLGKRKVREGLVVSDKMDKTVVVVVETKKIHPLYKKASRVTKKYKAHDENNACKIGDKVKIVETRPLSNEKSWRVMEIMSKKEMVETRPKKPRKKK
jgi:small subunit ribosomal protein S17